MSAPIEFLHLDDLLRLAERLLGSPVPVRDVGLLGSAAARPQTSVFGEDAYPDVWTMAAALLQSIVKNHPLVDGNKRLGWLATAVFLELNGVEATAAGNDQVYEVIVAIAAGDHDVDEIALMLRSAIEAS